MGGAQGVDANPSSTASAVPRVGRHAVRARLAAVLCAGLGAVPIRGQAPSTPLLDGTPVLLRMQSAITSETSQPGDPIRLVVLRDVVSGGSVLISRRAEATGTVVVAEPMHLGFISHRGRLAFRIDQVPAVDGQSIRLRASQAARSPDQIVVDRARLHHQIQWADGGDFFEAFVNGNYVIAVP